MSKHESLQKLLELAQKQSDESIKKLGRKNAQLQEAEQKLDLLRNYRHSYQMQLQKVSQNGIGHAEWRNFISFINKLDAAIAEQNLAVQYAASNRKVSHDEYQSCQRKLNAYGTISQRHQQIRATQQKKAEQKEQDEFASNRFARCSPDNLKE